MGALDLHASGELLSLILVGTLRQEILQSQQTRSDLLKWKLGLVGAIGAVGLGLAGSRVSNHADLVLCAVPLVCIYVDFLCRHLSLRILVIGVFFRTATVPMPPKRNRQNGPRSRCTRSTRRTPAT